LTLAFAVLALALVPGFASAAQTLMRDTASAHGTLSGIPLDIEASSDPLGDKPRGYVQFGTELYGPVVCLSVSGTDATVVHRNDSPGSVFAYGIFYLRDDAPVDAVGISASGNPSVDPNLLCAGPSAGFVPFNGEITIEDAQCGSVKDKPGTDKDKCKSKP